MYYFNKLLFRNLSLVLGRTKSELADASGYSRSAWQLWSDSLDPTVAALVNVCNAEHVSISHFITTSPDVNAIGTREDYILPSATWATIVFRPEGIGDALTVGAGHTVEQACEHLGISRSKFYRNFRDSDSPNIMHIDYYLQICNLCSIYPGDFLLDINRDIPCAEGIKSNNDILRQLNIANRRILELQAENSRLRTMLQRSLMQQGLTLEGYTMVAAEEDSASHQ